MNSLINLLVLQQILRSEHLIAVTRVSSATRRLVFALAYIPVCRFRAHAGTRYIGQSRFKLMKK